MIRLGPAGNIDKDILSSLKKVKEFGLQAQEIEFVRGVHMSNEKAKEAGKLAKELDVSLSIHAPYYINLSSEEKKKIEESKTRILQSCERGNYLNATHVVFHPGYFGKRTKEETYSMIKESVIDMLDIIKKNSWNVKLAPEITGKHSAFGNLDETIKLAKETKCDICIDAAHLYARNFGAINYKEIFDKLEVLKLKHLHLHFSGVNYSSKGELNHLALKDAGPDFEPLAKEILKRKSDITIISESPITYLDSLNMKKIFEKLGYKFI